MADSTVSGSASVPAEGTRSPLRRVLRAVAIFLVALVVLVGITIAAMVRRDVPVDELAPRYAAAPSQFLELDGMRVHYRDEGSGPPLVLVHGTSSSLHTWDGWAHELADTRRVVRFDLPGFALTGPTPDGDDRVERQVRFLAAFLDRLGVARADLAGNSLGGRIAATFAATYPERVRKLVLIDAAGFSATPPPALYRLARMPVVGRALRYLTPRFFVRQNLEEVYGDPRRLTDATVDRYHAMALRAGNRTAALARMNRPLEPLLGDRLASLRMPVLIQWGDQDRWIPVEHARGFQRAIAGAELRIYPGVGHMPMEEIPEQSARDADAFLGRD